MVSANLTPLDWRGPVFFSSASSDGVCGPSASPFWSSSAPTDSSASVVRVARTGVFSDSAGRSDSACRAVLLRGRGVAVRPSRCSSMSAILTGQPGYAIYTVVREDSPAADLLVLRDQRAGLAIQLKRAKLVAPVTV